MINSKPIIINWRLIQGGESDYVASRLQYDQDRVALPELDAQVEFCKEAEKYGIDGLLVDINYAKPDPILLSVALAHYCKKINFIVAIRSGLISPTLFTQQVNTFSVLSKGRISLNVVAGHSPKEQKYYGDFLPHDERYARTDEFMEICNGLWRKEEPVNFSGKYFNIINGTINTPFQSEKSNRPYIFIGGGSPPAKALALKEGDCWMQLASSPAHTLNSIRDLKNENIDLGLRLSVIARPTNEEAKKAAFDLVNNHTKNKADQLVEKKFVNQSDSQSIKKSHDAAASEWLSETLWAGAIPHFGATSIALVGSYEEVANAFMDYKKNGISQFILSGWPKIEEMRHFGKFVLPLIRLKESKQETNYAEHHTENQV